MGRIEIKRSNIMRLDPLDDYLVAEAARILGIRPAVLRYRVRLKLGATTPGYVLRRLSGAEIMGVLGTIPNLTIIDDKD